MGGSSDDDDFLGALRGPSSFANAILYVGLGTIALGLVIFCTGTGEKGFKTVELRLIGPSLIGNYPQKNWNKIRIYTLHNSYAYMHYTTAMDLIIIIIILGRNLADFIHDNFLFLN